MRNNAFTRRALALTLCTFLSCSSWGKPPEHWDSSAYAYNATNTPIKEILKDFADSFGVRLLVSGTITGSSSGWMRASSAVEFLDRLSVKYKLQWFVYNNELYVSPITENVIKRIEISQDGSIDLKRALKGVGLLEEKFGWGEMPDEGAILISGPNKYVRLVQSLIKEKEKQKSKREEIMVFPLKHATVDDREIYIREQRVVIPGVASILRNLLEKKRSGGSAPNGLPNAGMSTLKSMEDGAHARLQASPWKKEADAQSGRSRHGIRVEADIRTNSVLIHDDTSRKLYYEELIETIDIPQNLIEIEAIIVDIDRSRLKELGVDWQYLNNGRGISSNVSGIGQDPVNQFNQGSATMLISDIGRFYASLRLLETQGEATVIANPSVLTLENQPAVIDLSETTYIETVGERVANVLPVTAGTMLRVTPRKIRDKHTQRIQLIVDIEDGRIEQKSAGDLPRVKRNTIATKAVIDKDYSLVVGGYHLQEQTHKLNKVPFLGDIPYLGKIFTSEDKSVSHRERLFILTPHISGYRHHAQDYSQLDEEQVISGSIEQAKQRKARSSLSLVKQVSSLFKHLVQEELPDGYKLSDNSKLPTCDFPQVNFDFSHGREVVGGGVNVSIGTIENLSNSMITVKESACSTPGLIAVSIWPTSELAANQKAEIFVARESRPKKKLARLPSLIQ